MSVIAEQKKTLPTVKAKREDEECYRGPKFSPPLYRQRYRMCADILKRYGITSVVDFGCDDCHLVRYLKTVPGLTRIALVDIDSVSIEMNKRKIEPLITDYLIPRDDALSITMYHGNVTEYDSRLGDFEAATMVEVIEHLEEKPLQEFPNTLFRKLHPRVVIITTPNVEFDVLFPDKVGFRHWDHKFEWTREEFKKWCTEQAYHYNYDVEYTGVGTAPPHSDPLGFCTQAAIFVSRTNEKPVNIPETHTYTVMCSAIHPHRTETLTEEEKLKQDVDYIIRNLSLDPDLLMDYETKFIPIDRLFNFTRLKKHFQGIEAFRKYLVDHLYPLSEDNVNLLYTIEYEDSSEASEGEDRCWTNSDNDGKYSDADNDITLDKSKWQPPEPVEMWD